MHYIRKPASWLCCTMQYLMRPSRPKPAGRALWIRQELWQILTTPTYCIGYWPSSQAQQASRWLTPLPLLLLTHWMSVTPNSLMRLMQFNCCSLITACCSDDVRLLAFYKRRQQWVCSSTAEPTDESHRYINKGRKASWLFQPAGLSFLMHERSLEVGN